MFLSEETALAVTKSKISEYAKSSTLVSMISICKSNSFETISRNLTLFCCGSKIVKFNSGFVIKYGTEGNPAPAPISRIFPDLFLPKAVSRQMIDSYIPSSQSTSSLKPVKFITLLYSSIKSTYLSSLEKISSLLICNFVFSLKVINEL